MVRLVEVRHGADSALASQARRGARGDKWAQDAGLLLRRGARGLERPRPVPLDEAVDLCRWLALEAPTSGSGFCWGAVIRSPGKLREKWAELVAAQEASGRAARGRVTETFAAAARRLEELP